MISQTLIITSGIVRTILLQTVLSDRRFGVPICQTAIIFPRKSKKTFILHFKHPFNYDILNNAAYRN